MRGVQEAFYWVELLDNNAVRWDLDDIRKGRISVGTELSCRAFWRGRNKATNEKVKTHKPKGSRPKGMRPNIQRD